jgi:hypothetical protein
LFVGLLVGWFIYLFYVFSVVYLFISMFQNAGGFMKFEEFVSKYGKSESIKIVKSTGGSLRSTLVRKQGWIIFSFLFFLFYLILLFYLFYLIIVFSF